MTRSEIWHVKIGTKIKETDVFGNTQIGTVIKRELNEECHGFIIAREKKTGKIIEKDLKTGKYYLTITINFGKYNKYIDTNAETYRLKYYEII